MGLSNLTFDKQLVIGTVVQNKDKHVSEYHEAYTGWKATCYKKVNHEVSQQALGHKPDTSFRFPSEPESHEDDYNRVIDMLELSEDETIVLTEDEFNKYMRDQWAWTNQHTQTYLAYTTG